MNGAAPPNPAPSVESAMSSAPTSAARIVPTGRSQWGLRAAEDTRRALTRLVPQLEYRLARLGVAGLAGIAALCAAVAVTLAMWLPEHESAVALTAELSSPGTIDAGGAPRGATERLIAELPTRLQIPAVLGQVLAQAKATGISLDEGHYGYVPPRAGRLGRYSFEFPIKAPYPNIRDFINGTLKAVPAAGLDKLKIERKAIGDATIDADIGFVVLVRGP